MNWTIKDVKKLGREYLQNSYWKTWFITTLLSFISLGTTFSAIISLAQQIPYILDDILEDISTTERVLNVQAVAVIITLSCGILLLNVIIKACIAIFIKNPATVGAVQYMRKISKEEPDGQIADLAFAFDNHYLNHVKNMLVMNVVTFLFSFLLLIPGVIKSYQYRMVPYILAEQPTLEPKAALQLSKQMMNGQKMKLFLFDLSFIPWHLLGTLTLGVLEVFFVIPWGYTAEVAIYNELRKGI